MSRSCRTIVTASAVGLVLVAASCGSSTTAPAGPRGSGPVNVLYAGSLVSLMTKQVGPAFDKATGYSFTGFSGDSGALANQIKAKVHQGDLFISASAAKDALLQGSGNGNWVSWYATFASSSLVLGYNPAGKFAAELKSKPWYQVITEPGILVGRTDPATDPKGVLTVKALDGAAATEGQPLLKSIATSTSNVFPEDTLVGRLQAGQLDAGFFYAAEAKAAKIPTVPLTGLDLKATYTITVLNDAPDVAGAEAFITYLLGPAAKGPLTADGFNLVRPPTVSGTGVPAALKRVIPAG